MLIKVQGTLIDANEVIAVREEDHALTAHLRGGGSVQIGGRYPTSTQTRLAMDAILKAAQCNL